MKMIAALILIALSGCGGGSGGGDGSASSGASPVHFPCGDLRNASGDPFGNNHECGFAFDAEGPQGLKLRYKTVAQDYTGPVFPLIDPASYEAMAGEVLSCLEIAGPLPPFVVLIDITRSAYFSNPPLLAVYFNEWDKGAFKHEYIHFLRDHFFGDLDANHNSEWFMKCDGLLPVKS